MRAGKLRSVVEVWRRDLTQGENGEPLSAYRFECRAAAEVQAQGGRETNLGGAIVEEQAYLIRLRWSPALAALTPSDRIKHGPRLFDVTFVQNTSERNQELLVGAREVRPQAEAQAW